MLLALSALAEVQPVPLWAQRAGGGTNDEARAVAVDPAGNVVVTGFFMDTASFGTTNLVSAGLEDIFLAKYDAEGRLLWARRAGGSGFDQGRGVATDASGNIFVTGLFQAAASFDGTVLSSSGLSDVFLAKYSPAGALLWVRAAGGNDYDEGRAVAVDAAGNAYITGFFDATASFGAQSLVNRSSSDDVFVAKCSGAGTFLWAVRAGGSLDDVGQGIAVDGATNVYVAGSFAGSAAFGNTTLNASGAGTAADAFLAKYTPDGSLIWVRQAGGTGQDEANAVAADRSGNVWLAGRFYAAASFGAIQIAGSGSDAFLARYDAAGAVVWVRRAGGSNAIYGDAGLGVAADGQTNAFLTGYFSGQATFDSTQVASAGFDDVFCAKYDAAGGLQWLRRAGGPDLDLGCAVAADGVGNVYVAGFFASASLAWDAQTLASTGGREVFLTRIGLPPVPPLRILLAGGELRLSWPAGPVLFTLESALRPSEADWTPVSAPPVVADGLCVVTLAPSEDQRFFRLRP